LIRRTLNTAYDKTFGAARNSISKLTSGSKSNWLEIVYVVIIVIFMAGGVSAFFFPVADQSYIIYPSDAGQTIAETVIDACVVVLGGAGIYAVFLSGRQTTKPRLVSLYLAVALLLIVLSVFMGIFVSDLKAG